MIIGFTGTIGSGKSFAAHYLAERHGYQRQPFAGSLKAMLGAFLRLQGADDDLVREMLHGSAKEIPSSYFGGETPRRAMQMLGTEWGRALKITLWTQAWRNAIHSPNVAVEDVRFDNEAQEIRSLGGVVVRIERLGNSWVDLTGAHSSEKEQVESTWTLRNDGNEASYIANIEEMLEQLNQIRE